MAYPNSSGKRQCDGKTLAGRRCSIHANSDLRDRATGKLIALPLQRGGRYCSFHTMSLCTTFSKLVGHPQRIIYFDLETTGLQPLTANIVELAAIDSQSGAVFSSIVKPTTESNEAARSINQIGRDDLENAPDFKSVFQRFRSFIEKLNTEIRPLDASFFSSTSPENDRKEHRYLGDCVCLRDTKATVLLVAHNARKYDVLILACECIRHHIPLDLLEQWCFADSLDLVAAFRNMYPPHAPGHTFMPFPLECAKLQCLASKYKNHTPLLQTHLLNSWQYGPHRALTDALVLREFVSSICFRLGCTTTREVLASLAFRVEAMQTQRELVAHGFEVVYEEKENLLWESTQTTPCMSVRRLDLDQTTVPADERPQHGHKLIHTPEKPKARTLDFPVTRDIAKDSRERNPCPTPSPKKNRKIHVVGSGAIQDSAQETTCASVKRRKQMSGALFHPHLESHCSLEESDKTTCLARTCMQRKSPTFEAA